MTPSSVFKSKPSNESIPLKSIFGRVLKDITNTSPAVGCDSQGVQSRYIPSPLCGNLSQSPNVASTSMTSCKSKSILFIKQSVVFINKHIIDFLFIGQKIRKLGTQGVRSSSRNEVTNSSHYQNAKMYSRISNYDSTVIDPKRLFGDDDINLGKGIFLFVD